MKTSETLLTYPNCEDFACFEDVFVATSGSCFGGWIASAKKCTERQPSPGYSFNSFCYGQK